MLYLQKKGKIDFKRLGYKDISEYIDRLNAGLIRKNFDQIEECLGHELFKSLSYQSRNSIIDLMKPEKLEEILLKMEFNDALVCYFHLKNKNRRKVLQTSLGERIVEFEEKAKAFYGLTHLETPMLLPFYWEVDRAVKFIKTNNWKEFLQNRALVLNHDQEVIGTVNVLDLVINSSKKKLGSVLSKKKVQIIEIFTSNDDILDKTSRYSGGFIVFTAEKTNKPLFVAKRFDIQKSENLRNNLIIEKTLGFDLSLKKLEIIVAKRAIGISFNMITAFLFILVNSCFMDVIKPQIAIYYPVITGLSGAFGTQTIARAITNSKAKMNFIILEIISGTVTALFYSIIIYVVMTFTSSKQDGLILGLTLLGNMLWASIIGCILPAASRKFGIDPSICSGPLLTASTDIIGFILAIFFCYACC